MDKPKKVSSKELDFDEHCDWLAKKMDEFDAWYVIKKRQRGEEIDWAKLRKARTDYFSEETDKNISMAVELSRRIYKKESSVAT